ncbi:MAG: hypothetical protein LBQ86_02670 [Holophagales bacterium]|jgi:DNA-binding phage protein|nr:hypothetical protein [Holophagales bacterium]
MTTTLDRFSMLYELDNEDRITRHLKAAKMDIDEGECEPSYFFIALSNVAKARLINQLTKETGIERITLCNLFLENTDESKDSETTHNAIEAIYKTFHVPPSPTTQTIITSLKELVPVT